MSKLCIMDCVDIVGKIPEKFVDEKYYISTGALDCDRIDYSQAEKITFDKRPSRANLAVKNGDVIFAKMQSTEKTLLIDENTSKYIFSTGFYALRAKKNILTPKCLYFLLKSVCFLKEKDKNCSGATQKAITIGGLKNIYLNIPDFPYQKTIVFQLEKIDSLLCFRRRQLEKLDLLIKSQFIEMFGEPNPDAKRWGADTLGSHLDIVGGYAFKSAEFKESGIPVLKIGNINSGIFTDNNLVFWEDDPNLERYKIYPEDLVMSLTGTVGKEDYGNVCIMGEDYPEYYLNQRNAKLIPHTSLDSIYLAEMLKFPQIKKRLTGISRGVRQANISNKDILELPVYIPNIEEQITFRKFVQQADKSKFAIQQSIEKLETLKKSLMQKYFG